MSADFNVTDPIFAWAQRTPAEAAVVTGDRVVSYAELCAAVKRAAAAFHAAGWQPGDVIGFCPQGPVTLDLVVCLALARIGVTQVTLAPSEPATTRQALAQALGVKAIVAARPLKLLERLPRVTPDPGWLSSTAPAADLRHAGGDAPWVVIQSSGTTATPKNIAISHRVEQLRAERLRAMLACRPGERVLNVSGLQFWSGVSRALRCLSEGGCLADPPSYGDAESHLRWLREQRVAYFSCAPVHLHRMLEKIPQDGGPRMPWLRVLRCSSAALPVALLQEAKRRLTPNLFVNYGTNEQGALAAADTALLDKYPDAVGRALPGIELEVVDEAQRPVAAGSAGEVRVRGDGMLAPLAAGGSIAAAALAVGGWHFPGDTGVLNAEGVLFLKGRSDDLMNFDGILIAPLEIEEVLAAHPAVAEAAAFSRPVPERQDLPTAAVVLKQPVPMDELMRYCNERLGAKAPMAIFRIDALPRNAMGKVLRRRLAELAPPQAAGKQRRP